MPHTESRLRRVGYAACIPVVLVGSATVARAQTPVQRAASMPPVHVDHANWELAERFSSTALKPVMYSNGVDPHWLGKSDSLWYEWKDHTGSHFYLVVPATRTKRPLFDQMKLAAALSELSHRARVASDLPFTSVAFTRDHKAFHFTVDSVRYSWNLASESLTSLGRMAPDSVLPDEEREVNDDGGRVGGGQFGRQDRDFRNFSPDSSAFVFAKAHNLYLVEVGTPDTIQITTDGVKDHSFGFRDTTWLQLESESQQRRDRERARDPRVRANVIWSPDSRAFAVTRRDARKVNDLYLVNVLAKPRPTMTAYKYAMPGEPNVPQEELYVYRRGDKGLTPVNVAKWQDQRLMDVHWTTGHDKLRLVRRDRLQRDAELIEVDLASGAITPLISESVEHASIDPQPVRYVRRGGDMIWWSERSGWGQYYLYSVDGKLERPLTSGAWHADRIVQVDTLGGVVWLTGMGREPGENPYFQHLYRVNGDGSGFTLLDSGAYNHDETLSPSERYMVDTYSRVDYVPRSVLRDARTGHVVMPLETMDISGLEERGWKPPTPFVVKAADGTTDIYGNMWKPFDFDSTKTYPIIAHVYPGPQTESVNTTFRGDAGEQELAQLGFIVIQIGNRGGSPLRSVAYHRYGYGNARDYALADKKAGIEQLAARYPWIDIDRVGIYGHSGGGFLTAAAMLEPPYNDFFKVGVSESGNHDNNIYNQNWSEWNYGLKLIVENGADSARGRTRAGRRGAGSAPMYGATDTTARDSIRFDIHVPTNIELAKNLKGDLLLVTGDMDNNVHPGNTIRLVDALIKANKRFAFMIMPGKPHAYGDMTPYADRMRMEYFAEHLLGDFYDGAEYKYQ
ncbi:MAG TPA: DPP IV N-terminal domain-containing protein [Gemmatimonadaceae bacterium]